MTLPLAPSPFFNTRNTTTMTTTMIMIMINKTAITIPMIAPVGKVGNSSSPGGLVALQPTTVLVWGKSESLHHI